MVTVNEETTAYVDVSFAGPDGTTASPTGIDYIVHDKATGTVMKTKTAHTPVAASVRIEIAATVNAILNTKGRNEIRQVTIEATYGTASDKLTLIVEYEVVNLKRIPLA